MIDKYLVFCNMSFIAVLSGNDKNDRIVVEILVFFV